MYQPKTGQKCSCKKGIERDNCQHCEGTGLVIDFKAIHEARRQKKIESLNNLERFRGFKVETLLATDTKPNRVKITDLRFGESVTLNYGANHNSLSDLIIEFFDSKGITLEGQLWAEKNGVHQYGVYLTKDFTIHIN